ncbi:macro domain-containing protein [Saccharothrix longispora]|uniref:type II toxin-antitoxin system antitoxin DNA ADP-ribosyl glycohydrolase DarG n=1 Tax=Saccharothrix longispora TaxID=33920 RepID=UPI0028FD0F51|nr:macro domain-containing protein [Saccharothrix longispora]MDU0294706.1 macro domain-containing protein [Saccharothrix longispora]
MLHKVEGNLLRFDAEALVNTVNTVGIMGKGIALQFKRAYPENFTAYSEACKGGGFDIGQILVFETGWMTNPKFILNFPTKRHWRSKSRLEDVEEGLVALRAVIEERGIKSIAVPPLGCGNGGLDWSAVEPLMKKYLGGLSDTEVYVFTPVGAPEPEVMPVRTQRPRLSRFGAALLRACDKYMGLSLSAGLAVERKISLLEVHKVAYFLQVAGWPLRLRFTQGHYGPYAKDLDHFISSVEGHFVYGYGDGTGGSRATLTIDGETLREANRMLADDDSYELTLERFLDIVGGFEFPYGVELLSTVHFVVARAPEPERGIDFVVQRVSDWSPRKRELFKRDQAETAYAHLVDCALISG